MHVRTDMRLRLRGATWGGAGWRKEADSDVVLVYFISLSFLPSLFSLNHFEFELKIVYAHRATIIYLPNTRQWLVAVRASCSWQLNL